MWSPRNIASIRSRSPARSASAISSRTRLVGDAVLGVVQVEVGRLRPSSARPGRGPRRTAPAGAVAHLLVVLGQRGPLRGRGDVDGRHPSSSASSVCRSTRPGRHPIIPPPCPPRATRIAVPVDGAPGRLHRDPAGLPARGHLSEAAAATMLRILPSALSRGRYFMPQSGASDQALGRRRSGSARRTRAATVSADSTVVVGQVEDAEDDRLARRGPQHRRGRGPTARSRWRSGRRAVGELGQERVARRPVVDDRRVAEADVDRGRAGDARRARG